MNDVWVCTACKSINRQRDDRCYRCAGRRDQAVAQAGPSVRVTSAVANRAARGYSSSLPFALITAALILAVAGLGFQDALYRLDPTAGGFFLVLAAWVGFVGNWLVGLVGQWIITGMAVSSIMTERSIEGAVNVFGSMIDQITILTLVTEAMIAVGAILLVVIMMRIESRAAARDREIRTAFAGAGGA